MNISILISTLTILSVSIYDFYILKKSKVKTMSCVSSAITTLVISQIIYLIGLVIGSVIFGNDNNYYIIISVPLVLGIYYFRFKGREVTKGKVKVEQSKELKKKETYEEKAVGILSLLLGIGLYKAFGLLGVGGVGIGYGTYYFLNKRYNKYISVVAGIISGVIGYFLIVLIYVTRFQ
jgi:hypothetical protein